VEDSEDFRDALGKWRSLLVATCRTPRALKRFLNRVRFYAMRFGDAETHEHEWLTQTLARLFGHRPPKRNGEQGVKPSRDPWIVTLAVIEARCGDALSKQDCERLLAEGKLPACVQQDTEFCAIYAGTKPQPLGDAGQQLGQRFARVATSILVQ
jgi:hypothetical protein